MRSWRVGVVSSLVVAIALVAGISLRVSAQPAASKDVQDIHKLLEKYIGVINSPEFAKADRKARVEQLRQFYRPDASYRGEQPVFFGPLSDPVARGLDAHLENTALNFEYLFRQGMTYGIRIDENQVEVSGGLGVALVTTTAGYQSADKKTNYVTRGRGTLVLTKMNNQEWRISHEHLELFNPNNPAVMNKQQLTQAIERLPR